MGLTETAGLPKYHIDIEASRLFLFGAFNFMLAEEVVTITKGKNGGQGGI